ncbi:MAG: M57 family metalloprotease, partial [Bacteroidota bacterium]
SWQLKLEKHLRFLEETGFSRHEITFDVNTDEFVLGEDMAISRVDVEEYMKQGEATQGRRHQRRSAYIVSSTRVVNIKYYLDTTVPASWRAAIAQAIVEWNAVNGTTLFLSQVTESASADVRVNGINVPAASWIARAYLPTFTGAPGTIITVNTYYNYLDAGRKLFAMAHEMGHTFGLTHTNQTTGTLIPGTPVSDPGSVMNSVVLPWKGFTLYDQVAVQVLYPAVEPG